MNIFDQTIKSTDFETFEDDPKGARILLDCYKCGDIVTVARYHKKAKLLSWRCENCDHISTQEDFDLE